MNTKHTDRSQRAERRAAPKQARTPLGGLTTYPSAGGLSS